MKNAKKLIATLVAALLMVSVILIPQAVSAYVYKTMRDITAYDLVSEMTVGINIGNSLDSAIKTGSDETAWGNPKITKQLISAYKEAGFNTIRLPVTWKGNMAEDGTPNSDWLDRVQEVTDWILEEGLYCILNTHHEQSWLNTSSTGLSEREAKFKKLWTGIATRFEDYGDHLLFEGFNEILKSEGNWSAASLTDYENSNLLSQDFVDAVRATGGKNAKRILISSTYGAIHTTNGFVLPKDTAVDKLAVEFHCYYPQAFCFANGSQKTWGSNFDNNTVENYCTAFYSDYSSDNIPVILGEFGAVSKDNTAARVAYAKKVVSACEKYNIMPIWWDNGNYTKSGDKFALIDRNNYKNVYPEIVSALVDTNSDTSNTTKSTAKPTTTTSTKSVLSTTPSVTTAKPAAPTTNPVVTPTVKPAAPTMSRSAKPTIKLKAAKKAITLTLKKAVARAQGYQIKYSLKKNMKKAKTVNLKANKKSLKIKRLKSKKKYFVRARAYATVNGKKVYSKWSKTMSVKVK